MTMDFDDPILSYLQNKTMYVTMKKLKKLNDRNVKHVSHLILQISFLTIFDVGQNSTRY